MSKLAPRNAAVEFVQTKSGRTIVRKSYYAVFTAVDEKQAYERVRDIVASVDMLRCAEVLGIEDNCLLLEFIPGESLYELAACAQFDYLWRWQGQLVSAFAKARNAGVNFDSDPSNFIVNADAQELVVIDPVCVDMDFDDFAAVVYLWGLLKLMLRTARFWRYPEIHRLAASFLDDYLVKANVEESHFRGQLVRYVDIVIGWNKEFSERDGLLMVILRRTVAAPLYSVTRFAIRKGFLKTALTRRGSGIGD